MKMKLRVRPYFTTLILTVTLLAYLPGCVTPGANRPKDKLFIVVTTGMIKDAVENIARDKAEVIALMGPGVDPHLYKASHGDLEKITEADIIFYNGLHLEGKMGKVFEKAQRIKPVVAVADGIPESSLRKIPGYENTHDPHIWFNVSLWEHAVRNVSAYLQKKDTANADFYSANAQRYLNSLDSLHRSIAQELATIPESQRVLITAHDAFGYFGDAYRVEVRGLQGISTLSEFGLKDVTELVDFIIARKIKAIFVETSVSTRSIDAIMEGCQKKGWNVRIGGSLYSDAMGAQNTPEGTYIGMVSANVRTIVNALK
jgi:manganese/zinc/iron transport system substrate-binding protein